MFRRHGLCERDWFLHTGFSRIYAQEPECTSQSPVVAGNHLALIEFIGGSCCIKPTIVRKTHWMAFEINRDDIRHRIYLFGDMSQFSQTWTAQERHDVSHRPVSVSYPEKLLVFVRGECAGCFTSGIKKPRYCEDVISGTAC